MLTALKLRVSYACERGKYTDASVAANHEIQMWWKNIDFEHVKIYKMENCEKNNKYLKYIGTKGEYKK